jgi:hypothetical protein
MSASWNFSLLLTNRISKLEWLHLESLFGL